MLPDVDRPDETPEDSHRVVWFAPDRPVEGVTVYVRPNAAAHLWRCLVDEHRPVGGPR